MQDPSKGPLSENWAKLEKHILCAFQEFDGTLNPSPKIWIAFLRVPHAQPQLMPPVLATSDSPGQIRRSSSRTPAKDSYQKIGQNWRNLYFVGFSRFLMKLWIPTPEIWAFSSKRALYPTQTPLATPDAPEHIFRLHHALLLNRPSFGNSSTNDQLFWPLHEFGCEAMASTGQIFSIIMPGIIGQEQGSQGMIVVQQF